MTLPNDTLFPATSFCEVERDIILSLIYLEREARTARLANLAAIIQDTMREYLGRRLDPREEARFQSLSEKKVRSCN